MTDTRWYLCASANRPTLLYDVIRQMFRAVAAVFYATTETHGLESFPPAGAPTILCFNHGNGLGDPVVLIRKTPRMVRFCAKDALWKTPVMNVFIRNSGAVPVYRPRDHGDKARDLNLEVFSKVIASLGEGDCLGFAPEGVSRFLPYMEQPLKTGVARIAIDAVQQANERGDAAFTVYVVPVGLVFTHREKFRSDLCMRYREPIAVDARFLAKFGGDVRAAAAAITTQLNDSLNEVTINAPDWETTRLAMTAARLHHPVGADMSLGQYLTLLRGWVEVLKRVAPAPQDANANYGGVSAATEPPKPELISLRAALRAYQELLDVKKIKCERERHLISKGPRWNDSVAEFKMMFCGLVVIAFALGSVITTLVTFSARPILLLAYLYATMRCYEEGVAGARSAYSLYKLLFLSPATMAKMVALRHAAKGAMDPMLPMLPAGVSDHLTLPKDEARPRSLFEYYFPYWVTLLLDLCVRRKKRDWNEVLRLNDASTMDYVQ